jgi:hypothetical protein
VCSWCLIYNLTNPLTGQQMALGLSLSLFLKLPAEFSYPAWIKSSMSFLITDRSAEDKHEERKARSGIEMELTSCTHWTVNSKHWINAYFVAHLQEKASFAVHLGTSVTVLVWQEGEGILHNADETWSCWPIGAIYLSTEKFNELTSK